MQVVGRRWVDARFLASDRRAVLLRRESIEALLPAWVEICSPRSIERKPSLHDQYSLGGRNVVPFFSQIEIGRQAAAICTIVGRTYSERFQRMLDSDALINQRPYPELEKNVFQ